jgi:ribosomal protein S18 acetylase RimI-like enzyme
MIGYVSAGPKEDIGRVGKLFEIYDMGVSEAYRSKGVGKMLINECLACAKGKGFEKVFVRVYSNNVRAINFYNNAGFGEIEVGMERDL